MEKLTITEALAEIKTIDKRIAKKQEAILQHVARQDFLRDPLEKSGGQAAYVMQETQAIGDLERRKVAIRFAIQVVNLNTVVEVEGETMTIAAWLIWKREVQHQMESFYSAISNRVQQVRQEAQRKGVNVTSATTAPAAPNDVIINVDEVKLQASIEHVQVVIGKLDGVLSLKNATTTIEF